MSNLKEISYSDLMVINNFLEIRKSILKEDEDYFDNGELDSVMEKQNLVWDELHRRTNSIEEFKSKNTI